MSTFVRLEHGLVVDGKYVCDACNVNPPWEHRCHGSDGHDWWAGETLTCTCTDPGCRLQRAEVTVEELLAEEERDVGG